jgi:hypothetical protein
MKGWVEILDHGDDPGRYTIVQGDGRIYTCNENGLLIFKRRCCNPGKLVYDLRRESCVGLVRPKSKDALLKKFALIKAINDASKTS